MIRIKSFITDESGAVTTDWVVLTAGIVTFGILVMTNVGSGIKTASHGIATNLSSVTIGFKP